MVVVLLFGIVRGFRDQRSCTDRVRFNKKYTRRKRGENKQNMVTDKNHLTNNGRERMNKGIISKKKQYREYFVRSILMAMSILCHYPSISFSIFVSVVFFYA